MGMMANIQDRYKTANVVEKLIALNVIVFVLVYFINTLAFLFGLPSDFLVKFLSFPKEPEVFIYKPWSIITYAFLHGGIWHILSNMLILYYAGTYFLNYFSPQKLLSFYFLGAITGAVVYMLSYNLFPAFKGMGSSYLVGASAAVMAVLVGIATHIPNMRIRLMILGSIKFWYIAAFFVVLDVIQIPMNNAGGHLAHLGGALVGFVLASQLGKGNNIAKPVEDFIENISNIFSKQKKPNLRTVHKNKKVATASVNNKKEHQQQIDAILDKISKSGYDSLTKKEKDFLFNAGKEK